MIHTALAWEAEWALVGGDCFGILLTGGHSPRILIIGRLKSSQKQQMWLSWLEEAETLALLLGCDPEDAPSGTATPVTAEHSLIPAVKT